jgi:hypothetical protein
MPPVKKILKNFQLMNCYFEVLVVSDEYALM